MKTKKYCKLSESEIDKLLKSLPESTYIYPDCNRYSCYRRKTGSVFEDGITSKNDSVLYNHYISDNYCGIASYGYILSMLTNTTFETVTY